MLDAPPPPPPPPATPRLPEASPAPPAPSEDSNDRSGLLAAIRNFGGNKGKLKKAAEGEDKLKSIEDRKKKPKKADPSMSVQDEIKNAIMNRRRFMDGSNDTKKPESKLDAPNADPVIQAPEVPKPPMSGMENRISMMIPPPPAEDSGDDSDGDWGD